MISVIIPAYNEENSIGETISKIKQVFAGSNLGENEILVVNDGSTDRTAELAEAAGAGILTHPGNAGYGLSLKHGIMAARFDTIVIMDADATYRPENIPALLAEYNKGFDMVVGKRTGKYYHESWFKSPLRSVLKKLVEFTVGGSIPDINSGMRVFSRKSVLPYFKNLCNTFSFSTSLTLAYMMSGKFVSHIPIEYDKRVGRSKVHLLRDSLRTMQYIVESILFFNPLKLFLVLCLLAFTTSCLGALVSAFYAPITALWVFFIGVLLTLLIFSIGLLTTLLTKILGRSRFVS